MEFSSLWCQWAPFWFPRVLCAVWAVPASLCRCFFPWTWKQELPWNKSWIVFCWILTWNPAQFFGFLTLCRSFLPGPQSCKPEPPCSLWILGSISSTLERAPEIPPGFSLHALGPELSPGNKLGQIQGLTLLDFFHLPGITDLYYLIANSLKIVLCLFFF